MVQDNLEATKEPNDSLISGKPLQQLNPLLNYLSGLLGECVLLLADNTRYLHIEKLLDKEIMRVQTAIFESYGITAITENDLPEGQGNRVCLQEKVYMPDNKPNGQYNFVGRILGPGGSTTQCLQQCLGVKLMVRGRGSVRDGKIVKANLGKPKWEHLNEKLHLVLSVEDYENRARVRLEKASEYMKLFIAGSMQTLDKDDDVKQMQQLELAFRRELRLWQTNTSSLLNSPIPCKMVGMYPNNPNCLAYGFPFPFITPMHQPVHNSLNLPDASVGHLHRQQYTVAPITKDQQRNQLQGVIFQGQHPSAHALVNSFPLAYPHDPHHQMNTNVFIGQRPTNGFYSSPISPLPSSTDPASRDLFTTATECLPTSYPPPYGYWTGMTAELATFPSPLNGYTNVTSTEFVHDGSPASSPPILLGTENSSVSSDVPATQTLCTKTVPVDGGEDKQALQHTSAEIDVNKIVKVTSVDCGCRSNGPAHNNTRLNSNVENKQDSHSRPLQVITTMHNNATSMNNQLKSIPNLDKNKLNSTMSNPVRIMGPKLMKADGKVRYSQKHAAAQHLLTGRNTGRPRTAQVTVKVGSGVLSSAVNKVNINPSDSKFQSASSINNLKTRGSSIYLETEWPELCVSGRGKTEHETTLVN